MLSFYEKQIERAADAAHFIFEDDCGTSSILSRRSCVRDRPRCWVAGIVDEVKMRTTEGALTIDVGTRQLKDRLCRTSRQAIADGCRGEQRMNVWVERICIAIADCC